jgi:predicted restriction endonuclease
MPVLTAPLTAPSDAYLIASHIKPWRSANNQERIDGSNGLLLAPHVDLLFDRGLISFTDEGSLLVSPAANEDAISPWCQNTQPRHNCRAADKLPPA